MGEITLEQVDKIRERTAVTYEEAKAALEATGGDMLEAMILLERQGKAAPAGGQGRTPCAGGFYSTRAGGVLPDEPTGGESGRSEGMAWYEVLQTCWNILRNCTVNQFEIWRKGQMMTSMPVLVLILLVIFAMWVSGPLLLVGLLFGCRYRFSGPDLGRDPVNTAMEKMHDAVDEAVVKVKDELKNKKR